MPCKPASADPFPWNPGPLSLPLVSSPFKGLVGFSDDVAALDAASLAFSLYHGSAPDQDGVEVLVRLLDDAAAHLAAQADQEATFDNVKDLLEGLLGLLKVEGLKQLRDSWDKLGENAGYLNAFEDDDILLRLQPAAVGALVGEALKRDAKDAYRIAILEQVEAIVEENPEDTALAGFLKRLRELK